VCAGYWRSPHDDRNRRRKRDPISGRTVRDGWERIPGNGTVVPLASGRVLLAMGGGFDGDESIRVWSVASGRMYREPVHTAQSGVASLTAVRTPDGATLLVSSGPRGNVRLWDAERAEQVNEPGFDCTMHPLVAVPVPGREHHDLLAVNLDGMTTFWNPVDGWSHRQFPEWRAVTSHRLPDGGVVLAGGGADGTVSVGMLDRDCGRSPGLDPAHGPGVHAGPCAGPRAHRWHRSRDECGQLGSVGRHRCSVQ
jgi:hypothetical protein